MDADEIHKKFGDYYTADERTFVMGIDRRFTEHFAQRFTDLNVLETCTGGGFTTLSLAKSAGHVFTVEIDRNHMDQAVSNIRKAGLSSKVSFMHGNILDLDLPGIFPRADSAFIDPDWAVSGPDHVYRFRNSNTEPPADMLLDKIFEITSDIAIVLPPFLNLREFDDLPEHEREKLYLGESHELFCLYFGRIIQSAGETEFRVEI